MIEVKELHKDSVKCVVTPTLDLQHKLIEYAQGRDKPVSVTEGLHALLRDFIDDVPINEPEFDEKGPPLTFETFHETNIQRCEDSFHTTKDWSLCDWATAITSELGEACNLIKKLRRGDDLNETETLDEVCRELADVVIYVDLLVYKATGEYLEDYIIEKFNEVSIRVGSELKL